MSNPLIHTKPNDKIVAYFSTRRLYNVLPAAYNSLLAYTPDAHVYCFIEDDTLPFPVPDQVTCVNVTGQTFFPPDSPCYRTKYTYMILLKAAMTKIFPDADKLLILDVDTIVCDDVSPLWQWDLSHAYYAAVTEPEGSRIRGVPYANFGIVLLNLAKLRTTGKDNEIIDLLNSRYFEYPEQDAFNRVCGNRFDPLPPEYNVTVPGFNITGHATRHVVRHFAGFHRWDDMPIVQYWMTHTTPYPRYVVYAGDHRVQDMMLKSAKSLLYHNVVDKIFLLVDNDYIAKDLPPVFECINVSSQSVFPPSCPNIIHWYGYMTTLRAGLTRILPNYVERVLWLDPDTVVSDSIEDLWHYDISGYYFAAVEETRNNNHTAKPYYNAGVMYMNLLKLAEDGKANEIIEAINTTRYEHLEQDALNFICRKSWILSLPSRFSASYVSDPCAKPCITHYLALAKKDFPHAVETYDRPWNQLKGVKEYAHKKE